MCGAVPRTHFLSPISAAAEMESNSFDRDGQKPGTNVRMCLSNSSLIPTDAAEGCTDLPFAASACGQCMRPVFPPSLHLHGRALNCITKAATRALPEYTRNASFVEHTLIQCFCYRCAVLRQAAHCSSRLNRAGKQGHAMSTAPELARSCVSVTF